MNNISTVPYDLKDDFSFLAVLITLKKRYLSEDINWGPLSHPTTISIFLPHFLQTPAKYGIPFFLVKKCHGSMPFPFSATPGLIRVL